MFYISQFFAPYVIGSDIGNTGYGYVQYKYQYIGI